MLRKITALCLLSLMMVVAATSQGGLHYCLCLDEFYAGDCNCCLESVEADSCDADSCSSHCQEQLDSGAKDSERQCETGDCSVTLSLELDDHVYSGFNLSLVGGCENCSPFQSPDSGLKFGLQLISAKNGKRGPPGAEYCPDSVPLRIRHSVFRI